MPAPNKSLPYPCVSLLWVFPLGSQMLLVDLEELDGDGGKNHPLPRDLMFSPWFDLEAPLRETIGPITMNVTKALAPMGRKARSDLVAAIERIVPAIVANLLIVLHRTEDGPGVAVNMRNMKLTRYDRQGFGQLPRVIHALEETGWLTMEPGEYKKRRTVIRSAPALMSLLSSPDALADIVAVEGEEVIQLVARPVTKRIRGEKQPKVPIDYEDTSETHALRAEMEAINSFIAQHDVELLGAAQPPIRLYRRFTLRKPEDAHAFNLHGRLYGGFWMTLKASERHRLRIDGEPIADLDFAGMFPRLAYAHLGKEAPEGDLYAIPGLEQHREGAKAAFSALLSYETEMKSLPSRVKEKLPEGWTASRVKQAFAAHHPDLVPLFGRDIALDLMFTESRILMSAMRRLREAGIVSLPMHDGLMVPSTRAEVAERAMEAAALEIVGRSLPVALKA